MKYIFSILLCLILQRGFSQIYKTVGISYTSGPPTYTPAKAGSWLALDTVTWKYYTYNGSTWLSDGYRIQTISGCSAPSYTPTKYQSLVVINACSDAQGGPEIYKWSGSVWEKSGGTAYTAGTGIDITGGVITNTAPDQTVTMTDGTGIDVTGTYPNFTVTNTSPNVVQTLSISGQDLTLSNGGGTVEIPAGANGALGTGFTSGGGIGTIPNGTVAVSETPEFVFTHDGSQIEMKYETPSGAGLLQYLVNVNNRGVRIRSGDDDAGTSNEFTMDASSGSFSSDGSGSAITFSATNGAVISFDVPGVVGLSINSSDNTLRFTGLGAIMANMDISTRNAMASPQIGQTIFCTDATATDSSTGVMQVYNGSVWKNAW